MGPRSEFDFNSLDYQSLSPAQRAAVVQEVVRQAHVDRAKEIAAVARATWRGISRTALILGQTGASAAVEVWRRRQQRRRQRLAAAQLYAMDDRALRDIGLRRGEIEFAVNGALDPTRRPRTVGRVRDPLETLRPKPGPAPTATIHRLSVGAGVAPAGRCLSSSLP